MWLLICGHVQCHLFKSDSTIKFVNDEIYLKNIIGYVMTGKRCFNPFVVIALCVCSLTLSCRMTYIYIYVLYRTANLQMLHFIYYSAKIRTEYFKHAAHSPFFFSSKCRLFQNATFFGSCVIHILYTECAKLKKK